MNDAGSLERSLRPPGVPREAISAPWADGFGAQIEAAPR
jgi:hypothetical protein